MGAPLSQEELNAIVNSGVLDAQQPLLERQLAQAAALRGQKRAPRTTPGGNILSGIGGLITNAAGAVQENDIQNQLAQLAQQRGAAEAPGRRLQALLAQQKLAGGEQDLAAGKADMEAKAAERARLGQPIAPEMESLLAPLAPGAKLKALTNRDLGAASDLAQAGSRQRTAALDRKARQAGGGMDGLSSEALDQLATQFATTGVLPAMGFGKDAAAVRLKIANRAAELFAGNNLAQAKAGFGADTASLKKLQSQADAVNAFERTALANLDTFLQNAHKVIDTGSPLFNAPAREVAKRLAGSPEATGYEVSRQVAVQEISKVLSGSMGNQAVSDSARHEAAALLSPDASLAQIERAASILKQDMANRKAAFAAELGDVRARAGGGNTPAAAPIPSTSAGPTHYLISPDRKQRVPADAQGNPIGPPEPNPGG